MSYWENISKIEAKQTAKGIAEYGQTLEENDAPDFRNRVDYIEEELVDALKYLEWSKDIFNKKIEEATENGKRMAIRSIIFARKTMSESDFIKYLNELDNWGE